MTTNKNSVFVELYDLTITERKDDRFGRVVTTKSLNEDDLIAKAIEQRTDLSASTLRSSLEILSKVAINEIVNGASVRFGLAYFNLGVSGVFIGDNARWDSSQHSLWVKATPIVDLREAVANCSVDVRGMAAVGIALNSLIDVTSGEENSRLTPGGGVNLTGTKIKIDGDSPDNGLRLVNQNTQEIVLVAKTAILINDPSKITFIVPSDLPAGDYKLSISTQFTATHTKTKDVRTYVHDYILNVTR